eukprot:scaffold22721_cov137-Cylindrotheca_fusiformis.AAC.3
MSSNESTSAGLTAANIEHARKQAILAGTPYVITKQFPWKLHEMLDQVEERGDDDIVSWLPDGRSFRVHLVDSFVTDIMKECFNQTKYKSFQRQLNLWGFERNTKECPEKGAYYHPLFIRGRRDLCKEMCRKRGKGEQTSPAEGSQNSLGPFLKDKLKHRPDTSSTSSSSTSSTDDSSATLETSAPPTSSSSDALLLQQLQQLQQATNSMGSMNFLNGLCRQSTAQLPHQQHQQQHHHTATPPTAATTTTATINTTGTSAAAAAAGTNHLLFAQASIQDSALQQLLLIQQALHHQEREKSANSNNNNSVAMMAAAALLGRTNRDS